MPYVIDRDITLAQYECYRDDLSLVATGRIKTKLEFDDCYTTVQLFEVSLPYSLVDALLAKAIKPNCHASKAPKKTPYDNFCSTDSRLLSEVYNEGRQAGKVEERKLIYMGELPKDLSNEQ